MERFDFFMERFPICHGADVRLSIEFSKLTVQFLELTVQFSESTVQFSESTASFSGITALDRQLAVPSVPSKAPKTLPTPSPLLHEIHEKPLHALKGHSGVPVCGGGSLKADGIPAPTPLPETA